MSRFGGLSPAGPAQPPPSGSPAYYPIAAGIPVIMPDLQVAIPVIADGLGLQAIPSVVSQYHKDIKVEPVMPGVLLST